MKSEKEIGDEIGKLQLPEHINCNDYSLGWLDALKWVMDAEAKICEFCKNPIDNLNGNPGLWGVDLPYPGGAGKKKHYHQKCLSTIISQITEMIEWHLNNHNSSRRIKNGNTRFWMGLKEIAGRF